jgi:hypothetical protein
MCGLLEAGSEAAKANTGVTVMAHVDPSHYIYIFPADKAALGFSVI